MKNRVFLLIGYWILASVAAFIFGGYGDGSFVPYALLSSWPGFITTALNQVLYPGMSGAFSEGMTIYIALFFLYYAGLIRLSSRLIKSGNNDLYLVPRAIHLGGGLAFIIMIDRRLILPTGLLGSKPLAWDLYWFLASYVVSMALVLLWLSLDWRLAKKVHSAGGRGQ